MRNGTTANLKNKQILVNLNVLFRQITKFEGDMMKIEMKHQPGVTVLLNSEELFPTEEFSSILW